MTTTTTTKTTTTIKTYNNQNDAAEQMKKAKIYNLKNKALEMLPTLQSHIWKELHISNRDGSRLISILLKEKLISRTKTGGTFMITKFNGNGNGNSDGNEIENESENVPENRFLALLSDGNSFSPCSGCADECHPAYCPKLNKWVMEIKVINTTRTNLKSNGNGSKLSNPKSNGNGNKAKDAHEAYNDNNDNNNTKSKKKGDKMKKKHKTPKLVQAPIDEERIIHEGNIECNIPRV